MNQVQLTKNCGGCGRMFSKKPATSLETWAIQEACGGDCAKDIRRRREAAAAAALPLSEANRAINRFLYATPPPEAA